MTPEGIVVAAVEQYFSQPKFRKFSIKKEYAVQMGSDNRRADVVLIDSKGSLSAIAECKKIGVEGNGIDQLQSYLSATDTLLGIFANSTEPDSWNFYENLRRNQFRQITCSEFEDLVVNEKKDHRQLDGLSVRYGSPEHFAHKGGSMKIRPTMYVGLGTTGVEILNHLRELNFQEYGIAGIPIFRYTSIETDESNNGKIQLDNNDRIRGWYGEDGVPQIRKGYDPASYEVNTVIHTSIPHTEPIRERITNPNSQVYNKHLDEWLDERILDSESVKLAGAGAGNLRMAGRLSLWENWNETVMPNLSQVYQAFQHPDHKSEAERFLNRHFGGQIEVDNKKHNVFIVGTLCGGTCSGMLLDIAYYLRHIGNEDTKIYGIFTMYNEGLALGGDSSILLANCYASLVELDFYRHPETTYQATFPNGSYIYKREAPFDVATFLSATNMANWSCVNQKGVFDRTQLNRMAATDLFVRSLGIDALIEADLANVPKRDYRFGKMRNAGSGPETRTFIQYMFSSGVDVVGGHKDAIIKSADGEFIRILHDKWRASQPAPASPKPEMLVSSDILGKIRDMLPKTDKDAELSFNDQLAEDIKTIDEADPDSTARSCLGHLVPGGKYDALFEGNSSAYCQQYCEDLKESLGNFKGDLQLFPKRNFLNRVDSLIHAKLTDLEEDDSSWGAAPPNTEIPKIVAEAMEANTEIVSKQGPFGKDKSELNLIRFKGRMEDEQTRLRRKFTDSFLRKTLNNIRSEVEKLRREVQNEIDAIETKFTTIRSFLSEINESQKAAAAALSKYVHDNEFIPPESVEELISLVRVAEPDAFQWQVRDKLRQSFKDFVPNLIRYPQSDFDKDAPTRSAPYQEFTPYYENYRLSFEQQGGMTRLFRYLFAKDDDNDLRFKTQAEFKEDFAVPNLRVLYQMEAGYALDDISVADQLKNAYEAAQDRYRKGADDPIHIHKDPNKFDQEAIEKRTRSNQRVEEISKKDWRALRELIPRIREQDVNRFQNVLPMGNLGENSSLDRDHTLPVGELEVKVVGEAGFPETFRDSEQGWEKLAAPSKDSKDSLTCDNFRDQTRKEFRKMLGSHEDSSSLQYHITDLHKTKSGAELEESEKFYKEYIKLVENHSESSQG